MLFGGAFYAMFAPSHVDDAKHDALFCPRSSTLSVDADEGTAFDTCPRRYRQTQMTFIHAQCVRHRDDPVDARIILFGSE